ncbi:MAG: diguanylate cyclase [Planctomycetes bacterium]|nr:diguanylate cyclase [Planctomycetota bacterium]
MSHSICATSTANPLATMPSVLAICDLRRRIRRHLNRRRIGEDDYVALLALDPPAALRGLRAASAPIYGERRERWTVRSLTKALGPAISLRLSLTPERGMSGTAAIRRLWMRAIGTAAAAKFLAGDRGPLSPDEAYFFGLVHATPQWIDQLSRLQTGKRAPSGFAAECVRSWNLPRELAAACGVGDPTECDPKIRTLLERAALIADLAGFGGGDDGDTPAPVADVEALAMVDRTRSHLEELLRKVGLDFAEPDLDADHGESFYDDDLPTFGVRSRTALDEMALTLLACSGSESYRGIITALTAAAVRHGSYDRAFYTKWCRGRGQLVFRAKADLSSRRIAVDRVQPTAAESEQLRAAIDEERPMRLELEPGEDGGVIAALGVEEALVVPLNRSFESPSFLVLDRSLSQEPIRPVADANPATAMSLTGSLLVENLLLRKRRERAQKFASTDGLTRLLNRTMGLHALDQEIARATRSQRPLAVLLCDLDYFKQLNDSYGHLQGDNALRVTADVLRQTVRRSDSICRFGGEEFLVVLPETTAAEATVLAARLHTAVEERGRQIGLPLTISIGLATSRFADTWETILHRADQALYASKDRGRNRFSADTADLLEGVDESDAPGALTGAPPTPNPMPDQQ